MVTLDFLHRLSRFSDQLRMESAFQDSMEPLSLESLGKINAPNQPESRPNLWENSEILPTKMRHSQQQLKQGMASFLYHVAMAKTTVSLAIACKLGYRTMIVVHKQFLADQWRERIQQFCPGATIGVVQQNKKEVDCDFVIAMLQSLSLKEYSFSDFESIGTLIVDEAHHICAKVFSQSLFKMCPRHIYGLSATPERKDGLTKVLHWFMGPTFFAVERKIRNRLKCSQSSLSLQTIETPHPLCEMGRFQCLT